ncbi:hypothetical protein GCM10010156_36530 [Planobispora rosea]|uniref:Uncharacterized protein n=1 Tax=Planobispora rosea TaxID=35762 RepID=A0A8J3RTV7_PLARO|nr:hypothetical protein [Planobispora rosea]GGS74284.1 hypothetical protein GCM10010156_36530 [Planobispora rosea]GIH81727.1 hypothetical protein Pro02_01350 [Planobispora rosea]
MGPEFWLGIFGGALLGGITAELLDVSAWLAPRIIHRAAVKLPQEELRSRYEDEWLAELASLDGLKLIKLIKSISIWLGSRRMALEYGAVTARAFAANLWAIQKSKETAGVKAIREGIQDVAKSIYMIAMAQVVAAFAVTARVDTNDIMYEAKNGSGVKVYLLFPIDGSRASRAACKALLRGAITSFIVIEALRRERPKSWIRVSLKVIPQALLYARVKSIDLDV